MILMDDNFLSVVAGIRSGRTIFENLKKSIGYTLPHSTPEIIAILLLNTPLPVLPLLMLCIDLGAELYPALTFAHQADEGNLMSRPRRLTVLPLVAGSMPPIPPDSAKASDVVLMSSSTQANPPIEDPPLPVLLEMPSSESRICGARSR
jgi:sodium/potassium-transporting ATPase subunit alpha